MTTDHQAGTIIDTVLTPYCPICGKSNIDEFSNEDDLQKKWRRGTRAAIAAVVISVVLLLSMDPQKNRIPFLIVAASWYICPSIWFAYENLRLIRVDDIVNRPRRFQRFKMEQDAARYIWFGIAALIAFLARAF